MATANKRVFDAPVQQDGPVPAYKVVEVDGPHIRDIVRFDEKSKQITKDTIEEPRCYMVYFPRGHSIRCWTLEELEEQGFGEVVPLIQQNLDAELLPTSQMTTSRTITKEKTQ